MTSRTMMPTIPTVWFEAAWPTAAFTSVFVASPTAVPAAATRAVSSTAMPVAASQPKNAEPTLTPPNASFSRAAAISRVARLGRVRAVSGGRPVVGRVVALGVRCVRVPGSGRRRPVPGAGPGVQCSGVCVRRLTAGRCTAGSVPRACVAS